MNDDQWERMRADASDIATMVSADIYRHSEIRIDPREDAPDTWGDLVNAYTVAVMGDKRLPIYNGHTDKTIYTSPEANIMARFWHDMTHLRLGQDFTRKGETAVATRQYHDAITMGTELAIPFSRVAQAARLIYADTVAQVDYAERFGGFPDDQESFIRDVTDHGTTVALMRIAERVAA